MRWNGSAFEAVSSWFDTANGAVAAPDQAEAQGFYDAVAAEDYAAAARHASQDDIARMPHVSKSSGAHPAMPSVRRRAMSSCEACRAAAA